ncbi:MAG: PAS domain-containing protein [Planctomycetes bacterium]|nr:PAS domain-containing protein [Planctomycetota bacterium]
MGHTASLTGRERTFDSDEIIVSKTDLHGRITYANSVFLRIAQYTEREVLGQPHNLIRHPDMPRCIFRFLWDTIANGQEVFAYVVNRTKPGDFYWVFAHVTPTFDESGNIIGYHSSRRVPDRSILKKIKPLYRTLLKEEAKHSNPKAQWKASLPVLVNFLNEQGKTYEELIFSLYESAHPGNTPVQQKRELATAGT